MESPLARGARLTAESGGKGVIMAKPVCEVCGQAIRRGGIVAIRAEDASGIARKWEAYEREFLVGANPPVENSSNWPDYDRAHWYWGHATCLPDNLDYSFEGSRIRNPNRPLDGRYISKGSIGFRTLTGKRSCSGSASSVMHELVGFSALQRALRR